MTSSDESSVDGTPPNLKREANQAKQSLLPAKSRDKYNRVYKVFMEWKTSQNAATFSENVFLAYFSEQAKTKKPSTLWAMYSMLKSTVHLKHNVDLQDFTNLNMFLKRQSTGYKSKKSKVLTGENVDKFLTEAPDCKYLATKVALILGVNGACRGIELTNITINDIEYTETSMIVKLCYTKTKLDRIFVVRGDYLDTIRRYQAIRPPNTNIDRFFLNYKDGKCTRQPIGKHKIAAMPKEIAMFLELPNPECYTGHCLRRTSATLLADSGAQLTTVKRLGGWKSDKVAEGYIEDSVESKSNITDQINNQIKMHSRDRRQPISNSDASTSRQEQQTSYSPQASTSRQGQRASYSPRASTSRQQQQASFSPRASTSSQQQQASYSPQASTSRLEQRGSYSPRASTSRQQQQAFYSPRASTSRPQQQASYNPRGSTSPQHQQMSRSQPHMSPDHLFPSTTEATTSQIGQSQHSEIKQTNINVPGKTITFTFNNCPNLSNVTFNIQ